MSPAVKSLLSPAVRGIGRLPLAARLGLLFIVVVTLVGILSPLLVTHDPTAAALGTPTTGPNHTFWFGADREGRDVYSRLVAGTRRSLIVGFGSAALALVAGSVLGAVAATGRRAVDEAVMRVLDVVMAFPTIVLAAILVIAFGKDSMPVLVLAIGFVFTPQMARIVRGSVAGQFGEDYVAAERVIGATVPFILLRHVIRNCAAPIMVFTTLMVANAIVFEASLSFIGAGLQPQQGASSWGSVIALGQQQLAVHGWWATFFPGMVILATVLALNLVSEGISDLWAAPVARRGTRVAVETEERERAGAAAPVRTADLPGLGALAERLRADARPLPEGEPLLAVRDLRIGFADRHGGVDIVDGVCFEVRPGEVLGLIGESGCGKSLTAFTTMGLPPTGARITGEILFDGTDLARLSAKARRRYLGAEMAMVYQDALSALNPAMTIGAQLKQLLRRGGTRSAEQLMELVGLEARRTLRAYPHELSGGQRQRVVIAMALSRSPRLLIADEPTTALDVTVQAQIIDLLLRLRDEAGFALVLVSHDLAVVSAVADRVVVMYGGQVAETGATARVVGEPAHHYSRGLLSSVLSLEAETSRLSQIQGVVPSPADFPAGCRFADRCPAADALCTSQKPVLRGPDRLHTFACHHPAAQPVGSEKTEAGVGR